MAITVVLREALNQGISSGNFVDTKIILYSHRDSSGRVCQPKALYTNSHVLQTVPYFANRESTTILDTTLAELHGGVFKVLFGDFAESQPKDFNKEAPKDEGFAEGYGYLSDSDLEDDEDEKAAPPKHASKSKMRPFDPFEHPGEDNEEFVEKGKVVKIPDIAFVT